MASLARWQLRDGKGAARQFQVGVRVLEAGAVPAGQFWLHPLEGTCAVAAH